jgi:hypothetical protein
MDESVKMSGEWWVVQHAGEMLRTPGGAPVVSRFRELADEVAADVARFGPDPTAKASTFSLQASYLDFGIPVRRDALEENTAAIWPDDLFVVRPAQPAFAGPLLALWGPAATDRAAFRDALRELSRRELMTVMMAGNVLRSAVLGLRVVTTADDLAPFARGACERSFVALGRGALPERGQVRREGSHGRFRPTDMDEATCVPCCRGEVVGGERFLAGCALLALLAKMRRFAGFPEETGKK